MTTTNAPPPAGAPPAAAPAAPPPGTVPQPSDPNMVALTINGQVVTTKKGTLLVEAAKQVGVEIPVFCYHPKLKPVGACRMCLVEIEKMPRLQTACTTPVGPNMVVKTQSELAKGGQGAVISLLLANHPLDCPVCDKGGECPLQDNTFGYGPGVSKFEEEKRHNEKAFELSDKIVLDRERCILCYRCVRFHEEIPGDRALAVLDRGGHGEIGVLPGETYDSPFQGNTIDICPVGALTSRQYRFRSRPWDLKTYPSIACDDPVGSNLDVDVRDGRVLRVRPRENLDVNDEWISDRTRFGTVPRERTERLGQPLVRAGEGWRRTTWADALGRAGALMKAGATRVVVSPEVTNEAMAVAARIGRDAAAVHVLPAVATRAPKGSIAGIAASKSILVAGFDPWRDIPMLALWIHKAVANGATLVVANEENGLFRDTKKHLKGDVKQALRALDAADFPALAQGPVTILWSEALARDPDAGLDAIEQKLLGADAATDPARIGFVGAPSPWVNGRGAVEVLGADACARPFVDDAACVVAVGALPAGFSPKGRGVWLAHGLADESPDVPTWVDVVLPLAHPYEQGGSFTSLEGRVQPFAAAGVAPVAKGLPPGEGALPDWLALGRLSAELGAPLPADVRVLREHLASQVPLLGRVPRLPPRRLTVV